MNRNIQYYTGSLDAAAAAWAARLPQGRQQGQRVTASCPIHGGESGKSLLLKPDQSQSRLVATCWAGCGSKSYAAFAAALENWAGLRLSPALPPVPQRNTAFKPTAPAQPISPAKQHGPAKELWRKSVPVPKDPAHPARRWLARRNLWRPEFPLTPSVRWLPAQAHFPGPHTGEGSIITPAAPPELWLQAWPDPPAPQAVQIIAVNAEGLPALDRPEDAKDRRGNPSPGLSKRTHGPTAGAMVILGEPTPDPSLKLLVCEGLADALALSSRSPSTVIALLGISAMRSASRTTVAQYLASAPSGAEIWADRDQPGTNGRAPAGLQAAFALSRDIIDAGGHASLCHAPSPFKDPAEWAAESPFQPLNRAELASRAEKILAQHPSWPRWQVARFADTAGESH